MRACSFSRRLVLPFAEPVRAQFCSRSGAQIFPSSLYRSRCLSLNSPRNRALCTRGRSQLSQSNQPRQASSFWTITFSLIAICGGLVVKDIYSKSGKVAEAEQPSKSLNQPQQDLLRVIDTLKMTTDEIPPGHIGNITEEQEAKLQELWVLVLKVFGVRSQELDDQASSESGGSPRPDSPAQAKKKPKRKLGFFSRKDGEETNDNAENGISSGLSSIKISDGDDKYGQTKEFQQALADQSPEDLRLTFWSMVKHDNPDALLLRFLRARKWDVQKALIMLISTMRWRLTEMHVDDDIMKNGEAHAINQSQSSDPSTKKAGEEFMAQIRMGKSFLHGVDKSGRPMCLIRVRLHRAGDQSPQTLERYTVFVIETARMMLAPPIETAAVIFDMTDFSLANMDYTPVKFMIKCFEANYPESLGVVLIHKAPWIFSGIWNIIKGWLDPVVASKINFTKSVEDLEEFIPRSRIIKELGGDEDFDYKYVEPQPGENAKLEDKATRDELLAKRHNLFNDFQSTTYLWISASSKGDKDAAASEKAKRDDMVKHMREGYWELDPYVRARSFYDRTGMILGGGKIQFYPDQELKTNGETEKNGTADDAN